TLQSLPVEWCQSLLIISGKNYGFISCPLESKCRLFSCYLKVGVPLNGLVVWALGLRSRRHLVSFRVYVLNLALADLVLLLRIPLMLGYLIHNNSWPFGRAFCHLIVFLRGLGLYASAFLLCAVALERCLCLLRPVWARLRRPSWAVPLACGLLWVLAAILSAPYLHLAELMEKNKKYQCVETGTFNMGLFVTETIAGFILPLLVFLGSNLVVLLTFKQAVPQTPTTSTPSNARRMTRMYHVLFSTMLIFLTCWVPYFVCRFLLALAYKTPGVSFSASALKGKYISLYLVYIKSALNPILYVKTQNILNKPLSHFMPSNQPQCTFVLILQLSGTLLEGEFFQNKISHLVF
uniref:C3a anaphylatoxin chemotactic receptor-like n=1 Tax=Acanthochromis polyacanthus TaxID=80966 RepID=A0A3Q1FW02_9TELE